MGGKSNLVKLNSSSGDLFCLGEVSKSSSGFETLEIEVTWFGKTSKNPSYYKTILLNLEIYNLLGSYNEPNEKLIFDLKIPRISSEAASTAPKSIWSLPDVISQQYDSCLIISGNHGSRFHISHSFQLIYDDSENSDSFYRLLLRCFSPKLAEVDVEVIINMIYLDESSKRKQFEYKSINDVEINVESFRLDKPLLNLDPEKKLHVRYELMQFKSGLARFFASLLKVDESSGEIHVDISSFNRYLQYCEFGGATNQRRLNILVGVKIYNETNHAIALIRLSPNCDRTNLNLRFKKPFYLVRVRDEELMKPNKLIESVSLVDELRNSHAVEYQFCSGSNEENWLRIDEKNGQIYWNSPDTEIIDDRIEVKICARLRNSQSKSAILIETDLIIRVEKKVDVKPSIRVFNSEIPIMTSSIVLTLPLNKIISNRKSHINLFKFSVENTNLSLVTSSSNLFSLNDDWLLLTSDSLLTEQQTHYLHVHDLVMNSRFDVVIKLSENCLKESRIDLFVPIATKSGSSLIDLKRFLCSSDEFKYLVVVDRSKRVCDDCVYYSQTDGHLYLAKDVLEIGELKFELKLTSKSSDLTLIELNLSFYKDENDENSEQLLKPDVELIEIYVSIETKIGSVIYDSTNRINSFKSADNTFFDLVEGKLLLAKNLTGISGLLTPSGYFEIDFGQIGLRIYIIETIRAKFTKPVYYVRYESNVGDLESRSRRLISVELSPKSVLKLLAVESTQIMIKCVDGGYKIDPKVGLFQFEVSQNGELFLNASPRTLVEQTCEIFELSIKLKLESVIEPSMTTIFVEVANLAQVKFFTSFKSLSSMRHFNRVIKTPHERSISLYETLGIKRDQCELRVILIEPLNMIESYDYESLNGFLSFNSIMSSRDVKFDVICFKDELIARNFHLNVYLVYGNESLLYFEKPLFKIDVDISQLFVSSSRAYLSKSTLVFDLKEKLIDAKTKRRVDNWPNSGIVLKSDELNSNLIICDDLNGLIQLNDTILTRFRQFVNFSRYFHIQACSDSSDCRNASIELNVRSVQLPSQTDYFKEFYAGFTFNDTIKLRRFGFDGGYRLYKSRNELITIDYLNGLISTFDERDFLIVYNETYPISFQLLSRRPFIETTMKNELYRGNETIYVDFIYEPKSSSFGNFLMNLAGDDNRSGCEIWRLNSNNNKVTLDQKCNLFVKPTTSAISLKARLFDTYFHEKSKFINVNLNLTSAMSSNSDGFFPYYTLIRRNKWNSKREPKPISDISNSIRFNRLSFITYERFNLTFEGFLTLRFAFRSESISTRNNLLAYLLFVVNRDVYFVSVETIGCNLELRHNLTIKSTTNNRIRVDYDLNPNVWYFIQIQLADKVLIFLTSNLYNLINI